MNTTHTIFAPERSAGRRWAFVLAMTMVGIGCPAFARDHTWQEAVGSIEANPVGASFEMLSRETVGFEGAMRDGRQSIDPTRWSDGDAAAAMQRHYLETEHLQWRALSSELEREYHHHHHTPPVPEPGTWAGMALGLGALTVLRRMRRKRVR